METVQETPLRRTRVFTLIRMCQHGHVGSKLFSNKILQFLTGGLG